jgi:hypothetical protein
MKAGHPIGRRLAAALATLAAGALACATVGRDFPVEPVMEIEIGTTTQADAQRMFGDPWRIGIEDGQRTWTYGLYRYSVFAPAQTRDLKIRFDRSGVVSSYTFDSTHPADASGRPPAGSG